MEEVRLFWGVGSGFGGVYNKVKCLKRIWWTRSKAHRLWGGYSKVEWITSSVEVGGSRVHMDYGKSIESEVCKGFSGERGKGKEVLGYVEFGEVIGKCSMQRLKWGDVRSMDLRMVMAKCSEWMCCWVQIVFDLFHLFGGRYERNQYWIWHHF